MKKNVLICILLLTVGSIFAQVSEADLWKNKILYLGGSFGLGPIMGEDGTVLGGNLSPFQVDWQITDFLSLGSGLNFYFAPQSKFTASKQTDPDSGVMETYSGMETHILLPLILQFTHKPGNFSFEVGGGVYVAPVVMNTMVERTNDNGYTISETYGKNLFSADHDNPFGFIATASAGIKVWQGILFLDVNYLRDFAKTTVKFNNEKIGDHLWNMLAFNIGYKYGFFSIGL